MSVINQMLKDLDQRAPEQGQAPTAVVTTQNPSTFKIVSISVVVLLSLNALGFYIWSLEERVAKSLEQQSSTQLQAASLKLQVAKKVQEQEKKPKSQQQQQKMVSTENETSNVFKPVSIASKPVQQLQRIAVQESVQPQQVIQEKESVQKEAVAQVSVLPNVQSTKTLKKSTTTQSNQSGKMSVSRRQLSSKELVSKKLARAEKAININEITKAEQLFEEILIIKPTHKEARKKLAALWFGRKSYGQAVNLLSQGIAIDRQDSELRLLKARIHLTQGQYEAAFNTLKVLASFEQEAYQVMLANIAQKIEQYPSAISAYQVLIKMQPYSGRWHLGLAIIYDKNSQFSLAINEYALALTKTDLSTSSAKFAKERMQALGE